MIKEIFETLNDLAYEKQKPQYGEPKKVYLLTCGEYSDYSIIGVFSSRKLAEKAQKTLGPLYWDPIRIEEWTVNPINEEQLNAGLKPYRVFMKQNGDADVVGVAVPSELDVIGKVRFTNTRNWWDENDNELLLDMYVMARDEKHAVKIVNEKRAQIIAMNRWGKEE